MEECYWTTGGNVVGINKNKQTQTNETEQNNTQLIRYIQPVTLCTRPWVK